MCGIVGFVSKDPCFENLICGLEKLEYRGYDSCGIATIYKNKILTVKSTKRVLNLKEKALENIKKSNIGIAHTRWATHGSATTKNAHPHLDNKGLFAVVHNGIIENYEEIKTELIKMGVTFKSDTDTEVIAQLLLKNYTDNILKAISKTIKCLKGSFALAIVCAKNPNTIYAVKQFSPLIVGISRNSNMVSSDISAILKHTKKVVYLSDGDIAEIKTDGVTFYNKNLKKQNKRIVNTTQNEESSKKDGYKYYMQKEIMEQPLAIKNCLLNYIKNDEICFENLKLNAAKLKSFKRIIITACGSAYHAALTAKYVFEELLSREISVEIASELRYKNKALFKDSLLIVVSQSGETADSLAALNCAKNDGAYIISIVNVKNSSIAKASDDVIYTNAGSEIAVATTKGYLTQLACLFLLGIFFATIFKTYKKEHLKRLILELKNIDKKVAAALKTEQEIKKIANKIKNASSVFFIGRNIDYTVALEGSLKLKEISYIHSEAYPAGELKHGTISLIEKDTFVIALTSFEKLFSKTLSNIKEVTSRKGYVIAIASRNNKEISKSAKRVVFVPKTHPLLLSIVEIIPLQLLAYFVALKKGLDIDKPRNLAKSVTVE